MRTSLCEITVLLISFCLSTVLSLVPPSGPNAMVWFGLSSYTLNVDCFESCTWTLKLFSLLSWAYLTENVPSSFALVMTATRSLSCGGSMASPPQG